MIYPTRDEVERLIQLCLGVQGRRILTQELYHLAWEHVFLEKNYECVEKHDLSRTRRIRIGQAKPKKCRYCQQSSPATTFKQVAHTIPECIGNKILISDDECDRCNELFSNGFEHDFDIVTRPWRAVFGVKGKKKIPTYKPGGGSTRIDFLVNEARLKVLDLGRRIRVHDDTANKSWTMWIPVDAHIPMQFYRTLTKIGIGVLPKNLLSEFSKAIEWIRQPTLAHCPDINRFAACWTCVVPNVFQVPAIAIYRRKSAVDLLPSTLCIFGITHFMFVFALPLSSRDETWRLSELKLPRVTISSRDEGEPCWFAWNLGSSEPRTDLEYQIGYTYAEGPIEITQEQFDGPLIGENGN